MIGRLLFVCVVLAAIMLRFWQLGHVPPGVSNDEAGYIYSAYSIWKTSHDIRGVYLPISFQIDNSYSPLPVYLIAPFVGLFGLSPWAGRLPFAGAGVCAVILLFLITRELFRRRDIAIGAMALMAVSPWQIFFSRTSYEATLSLFFIMFGIWLFLRRVKRGGFIWCMVPFFLAFYTYHAIKVYLFFFIPMLLFLYWSQIRLHKREGFILLISFVLTITSFLWVMDKGHVTQRLLFLWNRPEIAAQTVNKERELSIGPAILRSVFTNKLLFMGRVIRENYLEAFSPQFLVLYGESGGLAPLYGVLSHGVLYLIDLPFLLLGIFYLLTTKKVRREALFLFGGLALAPLPTTFTIDRSYALRAIMMLPFLLVITAYGVRRGLWELGRLRYPAVVFCGALYMFFVASYLYQYYFRFPVSGAQAWFVSSRDLALYVRSYGNQYNRVIIANSGDLLIQFAIWNRLDPAVARRVFAQELPKQFGNVSLIRGCFDTKGSVFVPGMVYPKRTLYIVPNVCHPETKPDDTIVDRGEPLNIIWKIYKII